MLGEDPPVHVRCSDPNVICETQNVVGCVVAPAQADPSQRVCAPIVFPAGSPGSLFVLGFPLSGFFSKVLKGYFDIFMRAL